MDPKNPKSLWVESLFDVSEPYLYAMVLPPLVLLTDQVMHSRVRGTGKFAESAVNCCRLHQFSPWGGSGSHGLLAELVFARIRETLGVYWVTGALGGTDWHAS